MKIVITLVALFSFPIVYSQSMEFEDYNPPSTLVVPEHPVTKAKFPFIDVHNHQFSMPTQDLSKLVTDMDRINLKVMINLSGRGRGSDEHLKGSLDNVRDNYPNRFIVFTNIDLKTIDDTNWTKNTVKQIEADVKLGANGLKIYKSQGMDNKDSQGNRVKINDPRIDAVWDICGELGIPVLIHSADPKPFWDEHNEDNERWLELKLRSRRKRYGTETPSWETIIAEQHEIFAKHPNRKSVV